MTVFLPQQDIRKEFICESELNTYKHRPFSLIKIQCLLSLED